MKIDRAWQSSARDNRRQRFRSRVLITKIGKKNKVAFVTMRMKHPKRLKPDWQWANVFFCFLTFSLDLIDVYQAARDCGKIQSQLGYMRAAYKAISNYHYTQTLRFVKVPALRICTRQMRVAKYETKTTTTTTTTQDEAGVTWITVISESTKRKRKQVRIKSPNWT